MSTCSGARGRACLQARGRGGDHRRVRWLGARLLVSSSHISGYLIDRCCNHICRVRQGIHLEGFLGGGGLFLHIDIYIPQSLRLAREDVPSAFRARAGAGVRGYVRSSTYLDIYVWISMYSTLGLGIGFGVGIGGMAMLIADDCCTAPGCMTWCGWPALSVPSRSVRIRLDAGAKYRIARTAAVPQPAYVRTAPVQRSGTVTTRLLPPLLDTTHTSHAPPPSFLPACGWLALMSDFRRIITYVCTYFFMYLVCM